MWFSFTSLAAMMAFFEGVYSAPASNNEQPNSIGGYGMAPISWDLPVKVDDPTGATATVTGTIEEAIAQMEARYSGWNATFQVLIPTTSAHISAAAAAGDPESFTCDVPFAKASNNQILDGIHYLWGMSGTAKNGPGPGNCGRVSCSWWAAIYWCNDGSCPYLMFYHNSQTPRVLTNR